MLRLLILLLFALPSFAQTPSNAQILSGLGKSYARTAAEISASVTPTNYSYPVGNVLRYGADPTGTSDNSAIFATAVSALGSLGGAVAIPPGTYLYSSTSFVNVPTGVTIQGAGRYASTITTATATAKIFYLQGYGSAIKHLGFKSTTTQTGGAFIQMAGVANTVDDFNSSGDFTAINLTGVGSIISNGSFELGASGAYRIIVNCGDATPSIQNLLFYAQSAPYPQYAIDLQNVGALTITNVSAINQGNGLGITPGNSQAVNNLTVNASYFDTGTYGVFAQTSGTGAISRLTFVDTWTGDQSTAGFFINNAGTGIVAGIDLIDHQASHNSGPGVTINGAVSGFTIIGGIYGQNTYGIYDNATGDITVIGAKIGAYEGFTNNTSYGIDLATTSITSAIITSNSLNGNTSGSVLNNATAGIAQFANNVGYTLPPYTVSTLPACNSTTQYSQPVWVSDATSPTYNGALTGGGTVKVPVACNGSSWTSH